MQSVRDATAGHRAQSPVLTLSLAPKHVRASISLNKYLWSLYCHVPALVDLTLGSVLANASPSCSSVQCTFQKAPFL